jgi:hypothetical protein
MTDGSTTLSTSLREAAMLVDFSGCKWRSELQDPSAVEQIKKAAGATGRVGKFVKNILAGEDKLYKAACSVIDAARADHYNRTLPWSTGMNAARGHRLLPNVQFNQYVTSIAKHQTNLADKLGAFLADWPRAHVAAASNLGQLAQFIQYPTVDHIRRSFAIDIEFVPVPEGNRFAGLPDVMLQHLANSVEASQTKRLDFAIGTAWERVKEHVEHVIERLSDDDNKFRESTITRTKELVTLLAGFNVTKDPRMEEIRQMLDNRLAPVTAKELRKNMDIRHDYVTEAKAIRDKLASFGF